MQVGEQHTSNRAHALVCDQCFRYLGPLELQVGFRLLHGCSPNGQDKPGQQGASSSDRSSQSIKETALALLGGNLRVPEVGWAPENVCESLCTGGYIPLHLKQLLSEAKEQELQNSAKASGTPQQETLLGRAVRLLDGSDYLFCSHDCAGALIDNYS